MSVIQLKQAGPSLLYALTKHSEGEVKPPAQVKDYSEWSPMNMSAHGDHVWIMWSCQHGRRPLRCVEPGRCFEGSTK